MIPRYTLPEMANVWSEENRYKIMLKIELCVLESLQKKGIIPKKDLIEINSNVKLDIERIKEIEEITKHDLAAFVDQISESVNKPSAKWIHFGLTSSDILDTATAIQLKLSIEIIIKKIENLLLVIKNLAVKYKDIIMIGRTHGIHAEPITFGYKLLGWYNEVKEHLLVIKNLKNVICKGKISGVVGTYSQLDQKVEIDTLEKLGIEPEPLSTQVVPRFRYSYYYSTLACIAASIEKFATEIRHLQRTEVAEVEEGFSKGQKGSSAMPHKKNPISSENLCGMARLVRSYVIAGYENIALWHERDISHSSNERIILPDISIATDYILYRFTKLIENIVVKKEQMLLNLQKSNNTFFSQTILSALIKNGLKRQEAYKIVQDIALKAYNEKKDFIKLINSNSTIVNILGKKKLKKICSINFLLRNINQKFNELF